jgi:phosphinothricin acetyltransferase
MAPEAMAIDIVHCDPDAHASAIREIFNDAILNTTALYEYQPQSLSTVREWFGSKASGGYPVLGAIDANAQLMGFASYGSFRGRPAYKYTVEHSVYVHPDHRRRGVARALMKRLIELGQAQNYHAMIGGIDAENAASIALHEQFGFSHAGTIREAGFKFGRWLDLAFYQLLMPTPDMPADG